MKNKVLKQIIILSLSIIVISATIFNVTYSYLDTNFNNNKKIVNLEKDNVNLEVIFNEGVNLNGNKILPGYSFTKKFTIINRSKNGAYYNINLINVHNTFKENELVYYLNSDSFTDPLPEKIVPDEDSTLLSKIFIPGNSIQNYAITILFKDSNINQNYNQKAKIRAKLEITISE